MGQVLLILRRMDVHLNVQTLHDIGAGHEGDQSMQSGCRLEVWQVGIPNCGYSEISVSGDDAFIYLEHLACAPFSARVRKNCETEILTIM